MESDEVDPEEEEKKAEQPELPFVDVSKAAASSNVFLEALAASQSGRQPLQMPEAEAQSRLAWLDDYDDDHEAGESSESEDEVELGSESETDEVESSDEVEEEEEEKEYDEYEETDSPMVVDTSSKTWPAFNFPEAIGRLERAAVKERKKSLAKPKKPRTCPRHPDDQRYIDFLEKNRQDTVSLANDGFSDMTAQMKRMADKMVKQAEDIKQMTEKMEKQTANMAYLKEKLISLEKMAIVSQASFSLESSLMKSFLSTSYESFNNINYLWLTR